MLYKCLSILMCMKICYLKILYTDLDHIKDISAKLGLSVLIERRCVEASGCPLMIGF